MPTKHQLCNIDTKEGTTLGCICKDFATEDIEFISAYDIAYSAKKANDLSEFEHFVFVCGQLGMDQEEVRAFLEYQILTDFLLTNTDRHFGNFGVLRDSRTLEYIGMAPIFDTGNSMFWKEPGLPKRSDLLNIPVNSFRKREADLLRCVRNPSLVETERFPETKEIKGLLEKDPHVVPYADSILLGYHKK